MKSCPNSPPKDGFLFQARTPPPSLMKSKTPQPKTIISAVSNGKVKQLKQSGVPVKIMSGKTISKSQSAPILKTKKLPTEIRDGLKQLDIEPTVCLNKTEINVNNG